MYYENWGALEPLKIIKNDNFAAEKPQLAATNAKTRKNEALFNG